MAEAAPFFFAWVDEGTAFNSAVHNVCDEYIFSIEITQAENNYAMLSMEIENPGIGLLNPTRKQWAWLSWDNGTSIVPIFYGRIDAAPSDIMAEIITIELVAEPIDADAQKAAIANSLRVPPFWDAAWVQEDIANPDTVLETYTAAWNADRITHVISITDIVNAEDGEIEIFEGEHFYDEMTISKTEAQLKDITIKARAKWRQKHAGEVDLTNVVWKLFRDSGSFYPFPVVASFTSLGLVDDWPKPLQSIGEGWSMAASATAVLANDYISEGFYPVTYLDRADDIVDEEAGTIGQALTQYRNVGIAKGLFWDETKWETWDLTIPVVPIYQQFIVAYEADRERSEVLTITLSADTQRLYYDAGNEASEIIELNSEFIDQPVDDAGAMPIGDARKNSYFPTDRGNISIQYFLLLMRARLTHRARAINVEFETEWWRLAEIISCAKSVLLHNDRLPGGQCVGKIITYTLRADSNQMLARVTLGCAVGYGVALPTATDSGDTYAEDYANDWTELIAAQVDVLAGQLQYDSLDGTIVLDDDGVDFFNMTPESVVLSATITNGIEAQRALIDGSHATGITDPDPIGVLRDNPTRPKISLVPVKGGAFLSEYTITTAKLVVPKMIDLEAA